MSLGRDEYQKEKGVCACDSRTIWSVALPSRTVAESPPPMLFGAAPFVTRDGHRNLRVGLLAPEDLYDGDSR